MKEKAGIPPPDKERLLREIHPAVKRLSYRLSRSGLPSAGFDKDDLEQEGMIGAFLAIDRLDPDRVAEWKGFLMFSAKGCMLRYIRDRGAVIKVPRPIYELGSRLMRDLEPFDYATATAQFDVLLEKYQVKPKILEETLQHLFLKMMPISLDKGIDDEESKDFYNFFAEETYDIEHADRLAFIRKRLMKFPKNRRDIFFAAASGMTQSEIGKRYGFSQMHISRIVRGIQAALIEANAQYDRDGDTI